MYVFACVRSLIKLRKTMAVNNDPSVPILRNVDDPNEDNELDEQPTGCGASACCNPRSSVHRFIALMFMCLVGFGKTFYGKM